MMKLWKILSSIDTPLIQSDLEFMQDYSTNYRTYDIWLNTNYGLFDIREYLVGDNFTETLTNIQSVIKATLLINQYKYKTLLSTTMHEYDPISNYDRTERTEHHFDYGEIVTQGNTTNSNDEQNISNNTTDNLGGQTSSNVESETTFDSTAQREKSKNVSSIDAVTNTTNTTQIISAYTNTTQNNNSIGRHENTEIIETHVNGNIGVTTTQEMIKSEREVAYFSFYEVVFSDIISAITRGVIS